MGASPASDGAMGGIAVEKDRYHRAEWLESGEHVAHVVRSRAKYQIDDSIVTRMVYADFVLTDRRLAILTGFFGRKLRNEIRPEHLRAVSAEKAFKGKWTYWSPVRRKVLVLQIRKDGKDARMGIAIAAAEVEAWRDLLRSWLDTKA